VITDLGLTGGLGGVIGMKAEISARAAAAVARGERMQPADDRPAPAGRVVEVDPRPASPARSSG
jgi:calcineurin-like phosphoesterase